MTRRPVFESAYQAAQRIRSGSGIAIPGNNFRCAPETMLAAIEASHGESGEPRDLTLYYPMMVEAARGTTGLPGTGFNRLGKHGLLKRVIGGSFSRVPTHELNTAIREESIEAYNLPMGTQLGLWRAAARKDDGFLTTVGLETFFDPRRGGGRLNGRTHVELADVVDFRGTEYLYYPTPSVDVTVLRASIADERGNISFEREAFVLGALHAALAASNSGGEVIVEVDDIVAAGSLDPRKVELPGHIVTSVVRSEISTMPRATSRVSMTKSPEWSYSGQRRAPQRQVELEVSPRTVIARRALRSVPEGAVVNLGAGLPMYDISEVALWEGATQDTFRFSIEQGLFGGWPEAGGIASNPDAIVDISHVFDYYVGGGIDVSILSFAEIDGDGSVNVSRFGDMMPGCGGFVDITQNAKRLVFCGAFDAGGVVAVEGGRVVVRAPGRAHKFVLQLQQLTFNARARVNRAELVEYVTERAVFRRGANGLVLTEVAPGIDVRRDVIERIPFSVTIAGDLSEMDGSLFRAPARM